MATRRTPRLHRKAPPSPPKAGPERHGSDVSWAACHTDVHEGDVGDTCDNCHTSEAWSPHLLRPSFGLARHADTAFPLKGKHTELRCYRCHPDGQLSDLPLECASCYVDRHRGKLGEACTKCHSVEGLLPVEGIVHLERTGFALTGVHGTSGCVDCHQGDNGRAMRLTTSPDYDTCHTASHAAFAARACDTCHQLHRGRFGTAAKHFDHRPTGFELERRHRAVGGASCHPVQGATPVARCASCHDDVHNGQAGRVCGDCHRPDRWSLVRFKHNLALWPLRGRPFVTPSLDCHRKQQ